MSDRQLAHHDNDPDRVRYTEWYQLLILVLQVPPEVMEPVKTWTTSR